MKRRWSCAAMRHTSCRSDARLTSSPLRREERIAICRSPCSSDLLEPQVDRTGPACADGNCGLMLLPAESVLGFVRTTRKDLRWRFRAVANHRSTPISLVRSDHRYVTLKHDRLHDEVLNGIATTVNPNQQFSPLERHYSSRFRKPTVVAGQDSHGSEIKLKHR